jgi:hypothetical protein
MAESEFSLMNVEGFPESPGFKLARRRVKVVLRVAQDVAFRPWEIKIETTDEGRRIEVFVSQEKKHIERQEFYLGPNDTRDEEVLENLARRFFTSLIGIGAKNANIPEPVSMD